MERHRHHRCIKIKKDGIRCGMESIIGEEMCISHSQTERAVIGRRKGGPIPPIKMISILERQVHYLRLTKKGTVREEIEKGKLLLSLVSKIDEYKVQLGLTTSNPTFQEKIENLKKKVADME